MHLGGELFIVDDDSLPLLCKNLLPQRKEHSSMLRIAVCDDSLKELEVISEYSFVKEDLLCVKAYFYFFGIIIK